MSRSMGNAKKAILGKIFYSEIAADNFAREESSKTERTLAVLEFNACWMVVSKRQAEAFVR